MVQFRMACREVDLNDAVIRHTFNVLISLGLKDKMLLRDTKQLESKIKADMQFLL